MKDYLTFQCVGFFYKLSVRQSLASLGWQLRNLFFFLFYIFFCGVFLSLLEYPLEIVYRVTVFFFLLYLFSVVWERVWERESLFLFSFPRRRRQFTTPEGSLGVQELPRCRCFPNRYAAVKGYLGGFWGLYITCRGLRCGGSSGGVGDRAILTVLK